MRRNCALPERYVKIFRDGSDQVLPIPGEFELPGSKAIVKQDGNRLIIEPVKPLDLLALLATWKPLDVEFPDTNDGLLPLDDVNTIRKHV